MLRRWNVTAMSMNRVTRQRIPVSGDGYIGNERTETVDTNNELFASCECASDVEAKYESFWNDLNPNSENIVKVLNVEELPSVIDVNDIASVYSGRPGCMCGCRGKHTYASATREASAKTRGYAIDDNEVNDRVVKMIVNKMNKLVEEGHELELDTRNAPPSFFAVELPNRSYVAYTKEYLKK